jgi:hypothetical protein
VGQRTHVTGRSIKEDCLDRVIPLGSVTSGALAPSSSRTIIANGIIRDSIIG